MRINGHANSLLTKNIKYGTVDWFKLNIDRASAHNPGNAGIGGVFRNQEGDMIVAFTNNIGQATNG